jgi:hypothetical protein
MATDTHDEGGYKSPPASVDNDPTPWGPFTKRKIPIDDYHTCPCCDGKGYVGIVNEKRPAIKKRDVSIDDAS